MLEVPPQVVPYLPFINFVLNLILVIAYFISIRVIGTRWAQLQMHVWRRGNLSPRNASAYWWFVFPSYTWLGKVGELVETRFSRHPRHWFAPMVAIAMAHKQYVFFAQVPGRALAAKPSVEPAGPRRAHRLRTHLERPPRHPAGVHPVADQDAADRHAPGVLTPSPAPHPTDRGEASGRVLFFPSLC